MCVNTATTTENWINPAKDESARASEWVSARTPANNNNNDKWNRFKQIVSVQLELKFASVCSRVLWLEVCVVLFGIKSEPRGSLSLPSFLFFSLVRVLFALILLPFFSELLLLHGLSLALSHTLSLLYVTTFCTCASCAHTILFWTVNLISIFRFDGIHVAEFAINTNCKRNCFFCAKIRISVSLFFICQREIQLNFHHANWGW